MGNDRTRLVENRRSIFKAMPGFWHFENKPISRIKFDIFLTKYRWLHFYRDADRDVVLTHVRGHYRDAGRKISSPPPPPPQPNISKPQSYDSHTPPIIQIGGSTIRLPVTMQLSSSSSSLMTPPPAPQVISFIPQFLAPPPATQQPPQLVATDMTTASSALVAATPPPVSLSLSGIRSVGGLFNTAVASAGSVAAVATSTLVKSSTIENGEMDEASSLGTSVTGWRDPAPYRCGHCHQLSNWKHVIQVFLLTPTSNIQTHTNVCVDFIEFLSFFDTPANIFQSYDLYVLKWIRLSLPHGAYLNFWEIILYIAFGSSEEDTIIIFGGFIWFIP